MTAQEIRRHDWITFFDEFSRRHRGERVVVEVLDPEGGARTLAQNLPFAGISANLKDGESAIAVMLGDTPGGEHLTHFVPVPVGVRLDEAGPGRAALHVASASELPTRIRFRTPVDAGDGDKGVAP